MASPHSPYPGPSSYYQPSPPPPHVYANHTPAPVPSPNPYQYPAYHAPPPPPVHHQQPHHSQRGRGNYNRGYSNNHHNHQHHHNYPPPPPMHHHPHYPSPLHAPHPQHAQYSKYGYQPQAEGKYPPYAPYSYPYSPSTPTNGTAPYSPSMGNASATYSPSTSAAAYNAPPSTYSPASYSPAPAHAQPSYSPNPAHATAQYTPSTPSSSSYVSSSYTQTSSFASSSNASTFTPSNSLTASAPSFTPSPNAPAFTPSSSFTPSPNAPAFTPSPTAAPYTPTGYLNGWQQSQRLSPLPKQLQEQQQGEVVYESSPSYPVQKPDEYEEPREEEPVQELQFQVPVISESVPSPIHSPSPEEPQNSSPPREEQPLVPSPPPEARKPPPRYTHTGSISTPSSLLPDIAASSGEVEQTGPEQTYVIWSRRPRNPSAAPGIIFSTRTGPPEHIVRGADRARTPSLEEIVEKVVVVEEEKPVEEEKIETEEKEKDTETETETEAQKEEKVDEGSTPSSVATDVVEDTPATTVPGSPLSTTNVSVSAKEKEVEKDVSATVVEASSSAAVEGTSTPKPAPPPVKKSWASLLRSTTVPGAPATAPGKNFLPTSNVVGFSIPAAPAPTVSSSKKAELVQLLTVGPGEPKEKEVRIRPRGLVNLGNMCFANSVLQVLVYCPAFVRLFSELGRVLGVNVKEKKGEKRGEERETPLVDATVEFLREFVGKEETSTTSGVVAGKKGKGKERAEEEVDDDWDGESFIPTYVYDAMKEKKRFDNMRGGHQEDAEEFLGFYLDTLEEELLSILHSYQPPAKAKVEEKEEAAPPEDDGWLEVGKKNRMVVTRTIKATESPITRIFGGKFRSTLRAPLQKDSVIVEDWRSLRLDIQRDTIHTIEDALSHISEPQPVQVTHPSRPGVTVDASQQVLIESLPSVLVLHMKRFCYDTAVGGVVKVSKQVRFGPELTIGPDVMVSTSKRITRYKLFGALYHHGPSASGGHYTLDVLHPNRYPSSNPAAKPREGWVRIDDELVSDVRIDDVFNAHDRDDRCAYLLFYRRVR